jgi:hypothetical protein
LLGYCLHFGNFLFVLAFLHSIYLSVYEKPKRPIKKQKKHLLFIDCPDSNYPISPKFYREKHPQTSTADETVPELKTARLDQRTIMFLSHNKLARPYGDRCHAEKWIIEVII